MNSTRDNQGKSRIKRKLLSVAFGGLFASALLASAGAQADVVHAGFGGHGDGLVISVGGHNRFRNSRFRSNRFNRRGFSSLNRFSNRNRFRSNNFRRNNFRSNNFRSNNFRSGSSCRRVEKRGVWGGERALIGGTQCFDRNGSAYIVPNSRFLVSYY